VSFQPFTLQGMDHISHQTGKVGKIIDSKCHALGGYVSSLEGNSIFSIARAVYPKYYASKQKNIERSDGCGSISCPTPMKKGLIQWNCHIYNNIQKQPRHNLRFQPPLAQVTMAKPSPESQHLDKTTKVLQMLISEDLEKLKKWKSFGSLETRQNLNKNIPFPTWRFPSRTWDPPLTT